MMKKILYILLALFLLIAVVVVATPASWVVYQLQSAVPNLQVASVSGSAWRGQLSGVQIISRGYAIPLGNVTWQIQPTSLLLLQPCATFTTDATEQNSRGQICLQPLSKEIILSDAYADISASTIAALFGAEIRGEFNAAIETVHLQQGVSNEQLQVKKLVTDVIWKAAEFNNSEEWIPLGEILITLSDDSQRGAVNSQWSDNAVNGNSGPVDIDLLGQLTLGKGIVVGGTLRPRSQAKPALHQTLSLIGERDASGAYRIDVKL